MQLTDSRLYHSNVSCQKVIIFKHDNLTQTDHLGERAYVLHCRRYRDFRNLVSYVLKRLALARLSQMLSMESTYSRRNLSTSFLEGKVHPSKTRMGLTPWDSSILTNFIQNPTYLWDGKGKQKIHLHALSLLIFLFFI